MLVNAHDPALGGDRVDDPHAVQVEQRVELLAECAEALRLYLDELAVRAHQVDHERSDRHLEAVAWLRKQRFDRGVQRAFTHHANR